MERTDMGVTEAGGFKKVEWGGSKGQQVREVQQAQVFQSPVYVANVNI
jgi:hypothetical protein